MSGLINVIRKGGKKPIQLFSRVDEAAQELPRTKGTGKEFMAELKKQPGVKKAELDDRKLSSLESAPKMTKEEFVKKLNEKPAPKIEEDIKSNPTNADLDARAMELIEKEAEEMTDDRIGRWDRSNSYEWLDYKEGAVQYLKSLDYDKYLRQAKRDIEENVGGNFPKFQDWKLPGGENYREILLRLPSSYGEGSALAKEVRDLGYKGRIEDLTANTIRSFGGSEDLQNRWMNATGKGTYRSGHWEEPNVLAHMRVQDRVGPNGEKILHVEEIQSDWHQEGRKKGYSGDYQSEAEMLKKRDDLYDARTELVRQAIAIEKKEGLVPQELIDQINGMNDQLRSIEELKDKARNAVPDAPFKKNWHELATKRLMNYAIENGYDKVAFTPGAEQASRYNLAKQVEQITASQEDGKYRLFARDLQGKNHDMGAFDPNQLPDVVGKDLATKISAQQKPYDIYQGLDLQVGGEGMLGFYDKIIPNYLTNEYGKYGASVGSIDVPVNKGLKEMTADGGWNQLPPDTKTLHSIDITPQMREAIEAKGQPLYQAVGIGLTGAAAVPEEQPEFRRGGRVKLSDNPDTMMLELLSRRK